MSVWLKPVNHHSRCFREAILRRESKRDEDNEGPRKRGGGSSRVCSLRPRRRARGRTTVRVDSSQLPPQTHAHAHPAGSALEIHPFLTTRPTRLRLPLTSRSQVTQFTAHLLPRSPGDTQGTNQSSGPKTARPCPTRGERPPRGRRAPAAPPLPPSCAGRFGAQAPVPGLHPSGSAALTGAHSGARPAGGREESVSPHLLCNGAWRRVNTCSMLFICSVSFIPHKAMQSGAY